MEGLLCPMSNQVHSRGKALAKDVDFEKIARRTLGFTGADLQSLMNEAAILAARRDLKEISKDEISDALDRIIAGPEKKNTVMSEKEKKRKTSCISWVAEEVIFGPENVTTGASNDFMQVSRVARQMVERFRFSKKICQVESSGGYTLLGSSYTDVKLSSALSLTFNYNLIQWCLISLFACADVITERLLDGNGIMIKMFDTHSENSLGLGDLTALRIQIRRNLISEVLVEILIGISYYHIKLLTVDGTVDLKIPAGTQLSMTLVMVKKGVPYLRKSNMRSDQLVRVQVEILKRLSREKRKLIEELASLSKKPETTTNNIR